MTTRATSDPAATAPDPRGTGPKGRRAVIDVLKTSGPATAQAIADRLGVTAMAVRQHLYDMTEQRLVGYEERANGPGRPAKHWHLTEAADEYFPDGHADLAVGLIHSVRAAFGEDGIRQLIEVRTRAQAATYGKALDGAEDLGERLRRLADQRTREGYMAEARRADDGAWLFLEHHCPICSAARACSGLCASELEVFRTALGGDCRVERTEHLLAGARRCAYRVTPADP